MARILVDDWLTDDGLKQLEGWKRRGLTDAQIAKNIGISERAFSNWKKKNVPILQALKRGKRPLDVELENALIKKALGYQDVQSEVTEIRETPKGVQSKLTKTTVTNYPPDTGALIFLLKNRLKDHYRDKPYSEEERQAIIADTRLKELKAEILQRQLDDSDSEIKKVDALLEALNDEIFKDAESLLD